MGLVLSGSDRSAAARVEPGLLLPLGVGSQRCFRADHPRVSAYSVYCVTIETNVINDYMVNNHWSNAFRLVWVFTMIAAVTFDARCAM